MQIDHLSVLWLIVAIIAAIAEMVLPSFGSIFASLAAIIVAAIVLLLTISFQWQVVIFAVTLLLSIIFLRPRILAKMKKSKGVLSRTDALVDKFGIITVSLDPISGMGRALIEGSDWAVKGEASLEVNTKIVVTGADGIVLTVKKTS